MGANHQLLMTYGMPVFPLLGASMIHAPDYGPSVLNVSSVPCSYLEDVHIIRDLSGNGRHATYASGTRPVCLAYEGRNYLWMAGVPGTGTTGGSSVVHSALMVLDQFTYEMEIALDDWTPPAAGVLGCRFENGTSAGWVLYISTAGQLQFQWFTPGANIASSSANLSFANKQKAFIRVHYTRNTGSGNYAVAFDTSLDGVTWSALGAVQTGASTAAITETGNPVLRVGSGVSLGCMGRLYYFAFRNGGPAGTKVVNWDSSFATHLSLSSIESANGLTFTHSRGSSPNSVRALIGKGCVYVNSSNLTISNPLAASSADYRSGMLSCCQILSSRSINYGTSSLVGSTNPYGIFLAGTSGFSSNSAAVISAVIAHTDNIRNRAIAGQVGGAGYFNINGVVTTPAPSANVVASQWDKMFVRGNDNSSAVFSRMGLWSGASLPTAAEIQAYLEG